MNKLIIKLLCCLLCVGTLYSKKPAKKQLQKSKEIISTTPPSYSVQESLRPKHLTGISEEQIRQHWELYKGYVNNVNKINAELAQLRASGTGNSVSYADQRVRLTFYYNGMVLHEYYFGNLIGESLVLDPQSALYKAMVDSFGSYEAWKKDFEAAGKTPGIGWAILYADPENGKLTNNFIKEHENGNIAGFQPILVLDVWEHAYMVDHTAQGRPEYIAAFMQNINWNKVEERYNDLIAGKKIQRF